MKFTEQTKVSLGNSADRRVVPENDGEEDTRIQERRRLEMRFTLQWARLQQLVEEQLTREARNLTPGSPYEVGSSRIRHLIFFLTYCLSLCLLLRRHYFP